MWFPLLVFVICLLSWCCVSRLHEGICELKAAQAHCCHWNYSLSCSTFILYVGLSHVITSPTQVFLTHGDIRALLMKSGETFKPPVDPLNCWLLLIWNKGHHLIPFVLRQLWSVTCCIIPRVSWAHHPCPSPVSLLPFQGLIQRVYLLGFSRSQEDAIGW